MKHADEYRNPAVAQRLIADIRTLADERADGPVRIMEFCGGHTHAILRFGIRQALGPGVRMLSGPGCPVCVTADADIDRAIALARMPGVALATFGDMVRVPGSEMSLQEARAAGGDVRIVYSALDAVALAQKNPELKVVMLGIGFETTAPGVAASILQARELGLGNYYVLSLHKLTPPATRGILDAGEVRVDAILGPGHVTAIIGANAWRFLADDYGVPCAVSGFEPLDMLQSIKTLVQACREGKADVFNVYGRGVTAEGNLVAQRLLERVFVVGPALWRGLGEIPASGLLLRDEFADYDAARVFALSAREGSGHSTHKGSACRCGEVLRGVIEPPECPLFRRVCTPARPVGPCMVSAEGACAAHYRYGGAL
ncbi:MAG: hydrogenase formation protein HypD [Chloroflexi bacterium]|nr:hydrogenase formation protein HypD [Chloroflexota bacterium]